MADSKKQVQDEGLGDILVARKLLTAKQVERVAGRQEETGRDFVAVLLETGLATDGVLKVLAEREGLNVIDLSEREPDPSAATLIEGSVARRLGVLPVGFQGDRLLLAMADPSRTDALDEVASLTGLVVEPAVASRSAIGRAIEEIYGTGEAPELELSAPADPGGEGDDSEFGIGKDTEVRRVGQRLGVSDDLVAVDIHELLEQVLVQGASDLHLTAGIPPTIRLNGDLQPMTQFPALEADDLQGVIYGILTQKQREKFENELELDFSYSLPGKARFRVNIYRQRNAVGAAFRLIPFEILPVEKLGLPARVGEFAKLPRGLIVVTGPTGSGKSTTLASIVDIVNRERPVHIMTIEDPIEFLHSHKQSVVNQREVGADTHSFAQALKHVLRQDPDVILVGEMRDLETIHMAITAAETGHLVFGTLHTQDAPQTIDRIIDVFPPHQQSQVRVQLAGSLMGVVAQQLLPTRDGEGRAAACELLVVTPAVRNLIREGKTHQIYSSIQSGGQFGMRTMDTALAELVNGGKVAFEAAREKCHNLEEFTRIAGGGAGGAAAGGGSGAKARVVG